jgi:excisionase family DNA binding protein
VTEQPDTLAAALQAAVRPVIREELAALATAQAIAPDRLAFSIDETAATLGLSRDVVYAAVRSGELPAVRIGTSWRIPRKALEATLLGLAADGAGISPRRGRPRKVSGQ